MVTPVKEEHFAAFGRIVYWYGCCEVGFRYVIAGMTKSDWPISLMSTSTLTATNLANTVKAISPYALDEPHNGQLLGLVNRWMSYNTLRMQVAHHRWRAGDRVGSIKPTYIDVRTGRYKLLGFGGNEQEYTSEELDQKALELDYLNQEIKVFMRTSGLQESITIAAKAEDSRDSSQDGDGIA